MIYDDCQVVMNNAILSDYDTSMIIVGEKGQIELSPFYRPKEILVKYNDGKEEIYQKDYEYDDFYGEIETVHQGINNNSYESERYTHQDMIDGIKLMIKIKEMML